MIKPQPPNNPAVGVILAPANIPDEEDARSLKEERDLSEEESAFLRERTQDLTSTRALREKAANKAFSYLCIVSTSVLALIVAHGFRFYGFQLDTVVLTTLSGGTFISAIGMFGFVIKGLFPTRKTEQKPRGQRSASVKKRSSP